MSDQNAVLQDAVPWRHGHTPDYGPANAKFKRGKSSVLFLFLLAHVMNVGHEQDFEKIAEASCQQSCASLSGLQPSWDRQCIKTLE